MRVLTRSGSEIDICVEDAVEIVRAAPYVRCYDSLSGGDENRIDVQDLAFPAFLDAVPNFKALLVDCGWENLKTKLEYASECLQKIPNIDLSEWEDSQGNRLHLKRLFQAVTGGRNDGLPEFGPARATKLLHKKRPGLLPIIDSWQLEAWGKRADPWSTDEMVDVVWKVKDQMSSDLEEYALVSKLALERDETLPPLSRVRIYDILFWENSIPS